VLYFLLQIFIHFVLKNVKSFFLVHKSEISCNKVSIKSCNIVTVANYLVGALYIQHHDNFAKY
jgi:hypothetical protein